MRYWGATFCDDIFLGFTWINYIHEFEARFNDMLRGNNLHDILYMVSKIITVSWYMNIIILIPPR